MEYTLYIKSSDKISGTNNNATFIVNWTDFLDMNVAKYSVNFSYISKFGKFDNVADTKHLARLDINTGSKSYTYDTRSKCNSLTLGYVPLIININYDSNNLQAVPIDNIEKVIDTPTNNILTVSLYKFADYTTPFVDTAFNANLTDTPDWDLILIFKPI